MKHLLIGAAVVALAASPIAAQGNGHGKGPAGPGHGGHGPTMQGSSMQGPAMQGAGHGKSAHAAGSMAPAMRPAHAQHGQGMPHVKGGGSAKPKATAQRKSDDRPRAPMAHSAKGPPDAPPGKGMAKARKEATALRPEPEVKVLKDGRRYYSQRDTRERIDFTAVRRGLIDGCPPGLAKKNNGCRPPGLAKQQVYRPGWWGLAGLAGGTYAYDNGYLLRMNGDRVDSYVPLLGGALFPGNIWPSYYTPLAVPQYYSDYYDLGPPGGYRYADNVLYRVDPSTSAITSIAALLTGDNFQIGSPVPPGYDVYNVPYPYRSEYFDGPDARYRYSDGYIYQVDPTTQLVTAAIDMLAG
jgi:hypothetical protein